MIVPRALRANYDHQPRTDAVPHYKSKEESPRDATDTWVAACGRTTHLSKLGVNLYFEGFRLRLHVRISEGPDVEAGSRFTFENGTKINGHGVMPDLSPLLGEERKTSAPDEYFAF